MLKDLKVVGIGNALVDILIPVEDSFLIKNKINKGVMQLIDLKRASELCMHTYEYKEISGGSAANTIFGLSSLKMPTAYIGKVQDDKFGHVFVSGLHKQGIIYETPFSTESSLTQTGRCIVLITKDGERSMNTYLGATENLKPSDVDKELIARSEWLYLEGYRFDGANSKAAFSKAINIAKYSGTKIALTLSDPFCVNRHHQSFKAILKDIDLLFCNEIEVKILGQSEDLENALKYCESCVKTVVCTLAERGAVISSKNNTIYVPTKPVEPIDTTGAGDLFASGYLYGILTGCDEKTAGIMGNIAASEIITHIGPRPEKNLFSLFEKHV